MTKKLLRAVLIEFLILIILIVQYNIYEESKQSIVNAETLCSITEQIEKEYEEKEKLILFEANLEKDTKLAKERISQSKNIKKHIENDKDEIDKANEEYKKWKEEIYYNTPQLEYMGEYQLTAYCKCSICCGNWSGTPETASGAIPEEGVTVAVNGVPFGTELYIEGYGNYIVQDTGDMGYGVIDVFFNSHSSASDFGRKFDVPVYKVSYPNKPEK